MRSAQTHTWVPLRRGQLQRSVRIDLVHYSGVRGRRAGAFADGNVRNAVVGLTRQSIAREAASIAAGAARELNVLGTPLSMADPYIEGSDSRRDGLAAAH